MKTNKDKITSNPGRDMNARPLESYSRKFQEQFHKGKPEALMLYFLNQAKAEGHTGAEAMQMWKETPEAKSFARGF